MVETRSFDTTKTYIKLIDPLISIPGLNQEKSEQHPNICRNTRNNSTQEDREVLAQRCSSQTPRRLRKNNTQIKPKSHQKRPREI
jgi:hypothetical protein